VHKVVPLVKPGDVVSPPPKGTLSGRVVAVMALTETVDECRATLAALDSYVTVKTSVGVSAA